MTLTPAPGTRLGPYEITAKLGEGSMGEAYRATDTNTCSQFRSSPHLAKGLT